MGITDEASCASPRLPALAASFCVAAAAIALTLPSSTQAKSVPAGTTAFHFHATKVHGHVATFSLTGIVPESIRHAYLEHGHERRSLSLALVRAAARRGVLRVHLASSWAQPGREARVS